MSKSKVKMSSIQCSQGLGLLNGFYDKNVISALTMEAHSTQQL